ncbi:hypothetical protein [Paracoccus sanguinis]|uniref:hypothetical protein n=1 Tax=Paracoccus sanguinis TaxID=1545044 RepID=UPI0014516C18|nr:hypothetical protein [Paracoccus sanguinis]QJD16263.1 hypothetical protein HGN31_04665 [Paracoccus sanguinis]
MKPTHTALIAMLLMSGPALADGGVSVPLPDTSGMPAAEAKALMSELAQVNVITSNCPAYALDDEDWTLITGTGDQLAAQLGLDAAAYDKQVYGPAFKLLDDPQACDRIGPTAAPLVARLKGMGAGGAAASQ